MVTAETLVGPVKVVVRNLSHVKLELIHHSTLAYIACISCFNMNWVLSEHLINEHSGEDLGEALL